MPEKQWGEGVKPGGLTTGTEIRILLCYLLDSVPAPVSRAEIENVLVGEELVNYFAMAESLAQLKESGLLEGDENGYIITEAGRTVGRTLASDVPRTIKDIAVRGVIQAQQYAAKAAAHKSEIVDEGKGKMVRCALGDESGQLFSMELYMPDDLSANMVKEKFIDKGDEVYKLVLAALTDNRQLAERALLKLR